MEFIYFINRVILTHSSPFFTLIILILCASNISQQTVVLNANITVDPAGSITGSVKTIGEAITRAPSSSHVPFIIHIMKGTYFEDTLVVSATKPYLRFFGDGVGQTIISGNKSVRFSKLGTKDTATFSVYGEGLLLQDLTIENTAGPEGGQAVALYVEADRTVVYRCDIRGYQDTLWLSQHRQFYRDCNIFGTVDFIFGDASAILQNCTIWARKPIKGQQNAITAQGREHFNYSTGIVIQGCHLKATLELLPVKNITRTFLGRPWKEFARVVYMQSFYDDHISHLGWLEWNETVSRENLYLGEFDNYGPGADTSLRVNWTSVHSHMISVEAKNYTVINFIQGHTWIKFTNIPFHGGLFK